MPTASLENELLNNGGNLVCGVDEAGVGAWAGPLVVFAVIFHPDDYEDPLMKKLQDSKRLKKTKREELVNLIWDKSYSVSMVSMDSNLIDIMKMKRAHRECIVRSVQILRNRFEDLTVSALVDGEILRSRCRIPLGIYSNFVDKADSLSVSVAAASILAKTTRDKLMIELDAKYPEYGFRKNMGYGTAEHLAALRALGVTPIHRKSFAPVRGVLRDIDMEELNV